LEALIGLENSILMVESPFLPFGISVHGFFDCIFCACAVGAVVVALIVVGTAPLIVVIDHHIVLF